MQIAKVSTIHEASVKVVPFSRDLDIRNLDALPRGTGARYLECVLGPDDKILIAKQWRRKLPDRASGITVFVEFS